MIQGASEHARLTQGCAGRIVICSDESGCETWRL